MKRILLASLFAFAATFVIVAGVRADGVVVDSVEATSMGRGGTNIAHSDNGAVLLSNPAGILNGDGCGLFEVGTETLITDVHYSNPLNDNVAAKDRPITLPAISFSEKSEDGKWALGLGVFAPAGFSGAWDFKNPIMGTQSYQSFGSLVKILPAAAYRVADGLSIGATVGLAASYEELETPFYIQTGPFAGAPVHMQLKGAGVAPTWSVGLQYQLTETTTLGVVYSSEDRFKLDGHMDGVLYAPGPTLIPSHFDSQANLVWPQSVGIGLRQDLTDRQRVSLDVVWYDWAHAFKNVDLQLSDPSNPVVAGLLGSVFHDSIPLNWYDSVSVRFGYEWSYSETSALRAGYVYNSPAIPSSTLTPLIPGILEHNFSIGHGTYWDDWRFDFAYQFSYGPQQEVNTSALAGGDFSFSRINAQAHWIALSLTRQF